MPCHVSVGAGLNYNRFDGRRNFSGAPGTFKPNRKFVSIPSSPTCTASVDSFPQISHGPKSSMHSDMKTLLFTLGIGIACTASSAFGQGAAVIIKQRAKETAGRPVTAPSPAPAAQPGAPGVPPAPQIRTVVPNISKILADLAIIKSRPQAEQGQKDKLANDLAAVVLGESKPSTDAVKKLASTLADTIAGRKISAADQTALARNLAYALNAAAESPQLAAAVQGVKDALTLAGANDAGIQSVARALMELSAK